MWRNIQEFLDLVALQTADPTGAHPVIPASQLHILHRPCAVELMPTVGRVRHYGYRKAGLLDKSPRGHSGAKRCNSALSRMAIKCQGCRFRALGVKRPASKILCMVCSGRSCGKKVRVVRRVRIHSKVSMRSSRAYMQASSGTPRVSATVSVHHEPWLGHDARRASYAVLFYHNTDVT